MYIQTNYILDCLLFRNNNGSDLGLPVMPGTPHDSASPACTFKV